MAEKKFVYSDHPSITLVGKKPHLRIFEDFFIEEKLPKFEIKVKDADGSLVSVKSDDINAALTSSTSDSGADSRDLAELKRVLEGIGQHTSTTSSARWDRERYVKNKIREFRLEDKLKKDKEKPAKGIKRFFQKLDMFRAEHKPKVEETQEVLKSVEETFETIKGMFEMPQYELMEKHKRLIDAAIERLTTVGQTAKASDIEKHAFILSGEMTLAKDGRFAKYLTEEQIIKLMLKAEKGINIEFLRYYNELIPTDVIEKKLAADKMCVFDNYAVIHYDKTVENFTKTVSIEEERRDRILRHDPILVGLIQGSRKLYCIGDWETKDDDLTIEKVEEITGMKAPILSAFERDIKVQEENQREVDELLKHLQKQANEITAVADQIDEDPEL